MNKIFLSIIVESDILDDMQAKLNGTTKKTQSLNDSCPCYAEVFLI